jgi:hypothetical protein
MFRSFLMVRAPTASGTRVLRKCCASAKPRGHVEVFIKVISLVEDVDSIHLHLLDFNKKSPLDLKPSLLQDHTEETRRCQS